MVSGVMLDVKICLEYNILLFEYIGTHYRFGNDTSPAVLSTVRCFRSYLVILQCSYSSTPPLSCTDEDDVSVMCCELLSIKIIIN